MPIKLLNNPFFKEISRMHAIPIYSSALQKSSGYKEILSHYIKSKFGIKYCFEKFQEDSIKVGLKPISILYEYWIFFKILKTFLGEMVLVEEKIVLIKMELILMRLVLKVERNYIE